MPGSVARQAEQNVKIRVNTAKAMLSHVATGRFLNEQLLLLVEKPVMINCKEIKEALFEVAGLYREIEKEIVWILHESEKELNESEVQ